MKLQKVIAATSLTIHEYSGLVGQIGGLYKEIGNEPQAKRFDDRYSELRRADREGQAEYDRLVREGTVKPDTLENASLYVPEKGLGAFNEAVKKGPPNTYHPERPQ